MKNKGPVFRQSLNDFPCTVELGDKTPSWGINRWNGGGLRFIPPDDEGFALRGDKRQLLYKGRRRSHRFTIHNDTSFEYDCILLREPESNVVSLRMEGSEKFDFFRQPDFVKDHFLKGSYAVYKKETLIGEGTGKLCHIHRPLIIDARGRKVWGDLSVIGNELRITIPEQWLAEAKYPVVVDPTVGTTTIGKQTTGYDPMCPWEDNIYITAMVGVCKYPVTENGSGVCTAYVYDNSITYETVTPTIYTDVGGKPCILKSHNEKEIKMLNGQLPGWRSNTFEINGNILAGNNIWFGVMSYWFTTRFDYGGELYRVWWEEDHELPYQLDTSIYNSGTMGIRFSWYFTYTSSVSGQTYIRTLTQGVNLSDSRKLETGYKRVQTQNISVTDAGKKAAAGFNRVNTENVSLTESRKAAAGFNRIISQIASMTDSRKMTAEYKRSLAQNALITDIKKQVTDYKRLTVDNVPATGENTIIGEYKRNAAEVVNGETVIAKVQGFFRQCVMNAANSTALGRFSLFLRTAIEHIGVNTLTANIRHLVRNCAGTVTVNGVMKREQGFFSVIHEVLTGTDRTAFPVVFTRSINETKGVTDEIRQWGDYIRGLYTEAGSLAETTHTGEYYRSNSETVKAEGLAFRHLLIFIRILTVSFVRDYIIRRFLVAREEIVLKSCVTRDLVLESKVN